MCIHSRPLPFAPLRVRARTELIMNWGSTNKGLLNHWTRLLVMAIILGLDFYLHEVNPSATTSYTAHVGGFLGGAVMGIVLLDNLEVTWLESHFILPGAWAFAIAITAWAVYNYSYYFPPEVYHNKNYCTVCDAFSFFHFGALCVTQPKSSSSRAVAGEQTTQCTF